MTDETTESSEATGTEGFLDAESMARRLTDSLSRLDAESNRYASAATNLTEAAAATNRLVQSLREVGDDATRAIDIVASIGGPEIVAKLTSAQDTLDALARESKATLGKVNLTVIMSGAAAALALIAAVVTFMK